MNTKRSPVFVCMVILSVAIVIGLVVLTMVNINGNPDFWTISVNTIISIILAIGITYFLSQWKQDERKHKEIIVDLVHRTQSCLCNECAYRITTDDRRDLQMNIRAIANLISALKECTLSSMYKSEISYIEDQFKQYKDMIGNHHNETDFLRKAEQELNMYLMNISSKLDFIMVKLYKSYN